MSASRFLVTGPSGAPQKALRISFPKDTPEVVAVARALKLLEKMPGSLSRELFSSTAPSLYVETFSAGLPTIFHGNRYALYLLPIRETNNCRVSEMGISLGGTLRKIVGRETLSGVLKIFKENS